MALKKLTVMYQTSDSEGWKSTVAMVDIEDLKLKSKKDQKSYIENLISSGLLGSTVTGVDFKLPKEEKEKGPRQFGSKLLKSTPPKWEYRTESIINFQRLNISITNSLNNLGLLGWELVSLSDGIAIFKKQL